MVRDSNQSVTITYGLVHSVSENEFQISVNVFRISVNEFWISVNEFRISENNLNFRYRIIVTLKWNACHIGLEIEKKEIPFLFPLSDLLQHP